MSKDNIELFTELLEKMTERYELLERGLDEAQRSLTYGDYALVLTPSIFSAPFVIGRIVSQEEEAFMRALNVPMLTPETEEARYDLGFRYGVWHTEVASTGFPGYVHYTRLYPITEAEYRSAKEHGFRAESISQHDWFRTVLTAVLNAIEARESSPKRMVCLRCGSKDTAVREYYQGVMEVYAAAVNDTMRLGPALNDEIKKTDSRHIICHECGYESPDVSKEPRWSVDKVHRPGFTVLETVWDYGPDLPSPDWD